ncbi:DUF885 family protein [Balneola sp. MJW-20]|uniref:DUF885 family protein n=1 Tax=Gracilimonas aurantiaca TaxID=3234185 RepID=UPI003466C069
MRNLLFILFTGFLLLSTQNELKAQSADINAWINMYNEDQGALSRKYTLRTSDQYFDRFDSFYSGWLDHLEQVSFDQLERPSQVDFLLLKNDIERSLYFLRTDRAKVKSITGYLPERDSIMNFINGRRNGQSVEGKEVASWFDQWAEQTEALHAKLKDSQPLTMKQAATLSQSINDIKNGIEEAYEFYFGYDPDLTWWAEKPFDRLMNVMEDYRGVAADYIDPEELSDDGSGIDGDPIGREEITRRLGFEMISYTPQELIDIANKQYEWSYTKMLKASNEMGYGDDWKAALEQVKTTYVPAGEQPALAKKLADEAVIFLEERDLLTIPDLAKESWRMVMLSPEYQKIAPFFLGGEVLRIAYPTNTMSHEEKMMSMRGNNPHFSKAVVHHELIPGHHLQQFMNRRYATHRSSFRTPFWTEGWALYWEMVLWNNDFPESPEDKIGMLYWRMHRSARIVFSLNYHLGNWSPQECIDYLVEKVGHEYANAEAEVRRSFEGNYGPLYQIAYMTGAMQFYALRLELVESGLMDEKEFHDTILQNGAIPVAMVKALLTDEKLNKDFRSEWKFGDYIMER